MVNEIDLYDWFQWHFRYRLDKRSLDDDWQINRWKRIVIRFKGKLVKTTKDTNGKFDDFSISPKIKQIALNWSYELVESDLLWLVFLFM